MADAINEKQREETYAQLAMVEVSTPTPRNVQTGEELRCPSFEDEPWKSRADRLKPKRLDRYTEVDLTKSAFIAPLRLNHRYIKLYLEFLDTVPDACWIDEENDVD